MRVELGYLGSRSELGWLRRPAKYQLGRVLAVIGFVMAAKTGRRVIAAAVSICWAKTLNCS